MTLEADEPEILHGSRAWPEAQRIFRAVGVAVPRSRTSRLVRTSWYDTSTSEYEGAFCLIQSGSNLEYLVGRLVRVLYHGREILVYCVGGGELDSEFALFRRAYFALTDLAIDHIECVLEPMDVYGGYADATGAEDVDDGPVAAFTFEIL